MAVSELSEKDRGIIRSLRTEEDKQAGLEDGDSGTHRIRSERDSEDTVGCGRTEIEVKRVDTERKRNEDSKKDREDRDMSGHRSVKGGGAQGAQDTGE